MTVDLRDLFPSLEGETAEVEIQNPLDILEVEEEIYEYDRRYFFPLTMWLQEHRGERVTRDLLAEARSLSTNVDGHFGLEHGQTDEISAISNQLCWTFRGTIEALHDVRGEIRPWIVKDLCAYLVGRSVRVDVPEPAHGHHMRIEPAEGDRDVDRYLNQAPGWDQ